MGKKASSGHSPIPRGLFWFIFCLGLFWLLVFNFAWLVVFFVWLFLFCFECVEDIPVTLFIIIIFSNVFFYKDSSVLFWGTDDYIFQKLQVHAVCQRKAVFVFNVARTVFEKETSMWFTKGVQTLHSSRMGCPVAFSSLSRCCLWVYSCRKGHYLCNAYEVFKLWVRGKAWDGPTSTSFRDFYSHYQGSSESTQAS